ncbi:MAG: glycosyltransferase family A protein [Humidesulfovibrio sp.]|nr:glycosyltransferase family A protein [Humidesulfovibrio sp.]
MNASTTTVAPDALPKLSVVIPNYNDGRYLERCLCAVLSQDRPADEVVVFDDGSTDDSLERLEVLHRRWPQVKVVPLGKNQGVVAVLNHSLGGITGDWVHFLAADDLALPGLYHLAMREATRHPQAGALFGAFVASHEITADRFTETADKWIPAGYQPPEGMVWRLFHKAPALFSLGYANIWRTQALRDIGGFIPELGPYSDTVAFRCVTAKHGGVYLGGSPVVCVRVSTETYGGQVWKDVQKYSEILMLTAEFMRTRFHNLFPERYIRNWEAKVISEVGLRPWPKWRRSKHALSYALFHFWLWVTRLLGR